ncbi:MAG: hypothetical protein LBE27_04700, partial [Deltaproteobacteria bacterium]|nr:hypothetical protein [Deltaproteobacteria bacterium]
RKRPINASKSLWIRKIPRKNPKTLNLSHIIGPFVLGPFLLSPFFWGLFIFWKFSGSLIDVFSSSMTRGRLERRPLVNLKTQFKDSAQ